MLSTPPAITMSAAPVWISRAAAIAACIPDPHRRLTVWPGTSTGKPASSKAMRATLRLSSPAPLAHPRMTSSTSAGLTCARSQASLSTIAARSSGRTSFNCPPYLPIGVRAVATMTACRSSVITPSPLPGEGPGEGREFPSALLRSPSQEGRHPFRELRARRLRLLQVRLELQRLLEARLQRVVDGALGGSQRLAGLRDEMSGKLAHLRLEAVGGDPAGCGAGPVRLARRKRRAP